MVQKKGGSHEKKKNLLSMGVMVVFSVWRCSPAFSLAGHGAIGSSLTAPITARCLSLGAGSTTDILARALA